ncbi:MAG: arsenosugar biosynthesis radical SAM protein ArsS [Eggerthellaceae bacterium]|nr:arsenosugar biosynthesis radical SAM protein ArsS [Eggerthellaceae bacterium]
MELTTIHDEVREYYGRTLTGSDDLGTNAPHCEAVPPPKYVLDVMPLIADEIIARFYGCGSPIPPALEGCTVLDLGCGTGRDVYVLSKLVGETGHVIGVDMTPEQLEVAKRYQQEQAERFGHATSNVEFRLGYIEDLVGCGIEDESIDLVVSNCVVNLSPFKDLVMSEVYRVLKPGGELYFSDVYASRRLPDELRDDPILHSECLGGATYAEDFRQLMRRAGWPHFVWTVDDPMHVGDLAIETRVGFTSFRSRTIRAIKCDGLEETEEDYGQHATYLGGMAEMPRYFDFDSELRFVKGKPRAISGNTARMLEASRYGKYFEVSKPRLHRGAFNAERAQQALEVRRGKRKVDLRMLEDAYDRADYLTFEERVGQPTLLQTREHQATMQVNITYACNLACRHCYLECSPKNTEAMSRETMQKCLDAFAAGGFETMDITGGSPELHPDFEWFLRESAKLGDVIVRSNLTLLQEPEYAHFLDVYAEVGAQVVASLPFYDPKGTASQRGSRVFERAIASIRELNARGYGKSISSEEIDSLKLDLVYNVAGPFLPLPQDMIEAAYHKVLERDHDVKFDNLFAFNNWACGRFAADLLDMGMFDDYLALLADNFNAMAITRLMCLDMVNVDYDGRLYDCEPNHVMGLPIQVGEGEEARDATIDDLLAGQLPPRHVRTNPLCYSCAAGFGSSCGGSLV